MGGKMDLLYVFILTACKVVTSEKILEMVHLVYRHGARSPVHFYPNDKVKEKDWPDGSGRLTQKGMRMEYQLGKFLKERYIVNKSFIDLKYMHKQVYIRSSNVDRCLQSAESQLAGLYPPSGHQIWNPEIPWQPIPVHTVPMELDIILRPDDINCPRRNKILKEKKKDPIYRKKVKDSERLFAILSNLSGIHVSPFTINNIVDTTICEKTDGRPTPSWVKGIWNETLRLSNWFFLDRFRGSDELGTLLGGSFLWKINENMRNKRYVHNLDKLYKMNIYSGHDTSLLSLGTALDIDIEVPNFSGCIMIELYNDSKGGYLVEMFYRNDQSNNVKKIKLKNCQYSCPLEDFLVFTKQRTTNNLKRLCEVKHESNFPKLTKMIIIFGGIAGILIVIIVLGVIKHSQYLRKSKLQQENEYLITDEA